MQLLITTALELLQVAALTIVKSAGSLVVFKLDKEAVIALTEREREGSSQQAI